MGRGWAVGLWAVVLVGALAGCGRVNPETDPAGGSPGAAAAPVLTGATLTFTTLTDGKDAKSTISAQLLTMGSELGGEVRSTGTAFGDNTTSPALALSLSGRLTAAQARDAQLRLRLVPDGRDTWTFDTRLVLSFADGTQQAYRWNGLRLDETRPERTLALAGALVP